MYKKLASMIEKNVELETGKKMVIGKINDSNPSYPFSSFNFINLDMSENQVGDLSIEDDYEVLTYQPTTIISIESHSDNMYEAIEIIDCIKMWFKHGSYIEFANLNSTIVEITDTEIREREELIKPDEYRYGFNVSIRFVKEIKRKETTIETWKIKGGMVK